MAERLAQALGGEGSAGREKGGGGRGLELGRGAIKGRTWNFEEREENVAQRGDLVKGRSKGSNSDQLVLPVSDIRELFMYLHINKKRVEKSARE